jgi:pentatricopeptide repeat protein
MSARQLIPTQPIYTSLIQSAVKHGQLKRAWDTLHAMQQNYEQPDVVLYNVLLQV